MTDEYKKLKKISDVEYIGPKKTFTQELSKEEINKLLEGYTETSFSKLNKGFHVRYFKKVNNSLEFKMGGTILKKEPEYIILTNGTVNWSVQKINNIFYQQESISNIKNELEEQYIEQIETLKKEKEELISYIKILKKQLDKK